MGYNNPLTCPISEAFQVILASIPHQKIHNLIQQTDRAILAKYADGEEITGLVLFDTLGIIEWTHILYISSNHGVTSGFECLTKYIQELESMIAKDNKDLDIVCEQAQKIVVALENYNTLRLDESTDKGDSMNVNEESNLATQVCRNN